MLYAKLCNLLVFFSSGEFVIVIYGYTWLGLLVVLWCLKLYMYFSEIDSWWTFVHWIILISFIFLFTFSADNNQGILNLVCSEHYTFISSRVLFHDKCTFLFTVYRSRHCFSTFCLNFNHFRSDVSMKTDFIALTRRHSVEDTCCIHLNFHIVSNSSSIFHTFTWLLLHEFLILVCDVIF